MIESAYGGQLGSASDDDTQQVDESKNSTRHAVVDGTSDGAQACRVAGGKVQKNVVCVWQATLHHPKRSFGDIPENRSENRFD